VLEESENTRETGYVKFYRESHGYGFLVPDLGGKDVFVHASSVRASGLTTLRENQRLSYEIGSDECGKGPAAQNLVDLDV
jgi:CspA family cold shock protein